MRQVQFRRCLITAVLLLIIGLSVSSSYGQVVWTAYNDCQTDPIGTTHANVTAYSIYDEFLGSSTGLLKDFASGSTTGMPTVTFSLEGDPGLSTSHSGQSADNPDAGTDAYLIFNGIVDFSGNLVDSQDPDGWKQIITFTNLDPTKVYTFVGTAIRNKVYYDRQTRVTISGHDSAINNSSVALGANPGDDNAVFQPGDNTSDGYVIRWDDIAPGADGSFVITSEDAGGDTEYKSYPVNGFMLQEHSTGPTNQPPEVEAGVNRIAYLSPGDATVRIKMAATVTDDGLPTPDLTMLWTEQSKPSGATVQFDQDDIEDPTVTLDKLGEYILHLEVSDSQPLSNSDTVTINVIEPSCPAGDFDGNCLVDVRDLKILVDWWLDGTGSIADLDGDSIVNGLDFNLLAENWLIGWGALRVIIEPQSAIDEGAQWSIDGGNNWQDSGTTLIALSEDSYTIEFKSISNWNAPASEPVSINYGQTSEITRSYSLQAGILEVFINPAGDPRDLGTWSVDGQNWYAHGEQVSLPVDSYTIEFSDTVAGWNPPANIPADVPAIRLNSAIR